MAVNVDGGRQYAFRWSNADKMVMAMIRRSTLMLQFCR